MQRQAQRPGHPPAPDREELARLVAMLERSGMAAERPEAAALLARSRALLARRPARRWRLPAGLWRRERRPRRPLPGWTWPSLALLLLAAGLVMLLAGGPLPAPLAAALALPALAWAWPHLRTALAEGLFALRYLLRWAWLWASEPFSDAAFARLAALLDARGVMRGWRQEARALGRTGAPADVALWLRRAYGPHVARRFAAAMEERVRRDAGWTLRGGFATAPPRPPSPARLMRWSCLIQIFEEIAAGGALWAPPEPEPPPPPLTTAELLVEEEPTEPPERVQRRLDLRELIRRKREDITNAYGWRLKTAAEIAQRDAYLDSLRAEIAALERELGGLAPGTNASRRH